MLRKQHIFALVAFISAFMCNSYAQDIIVKNTGETIKGYNLEMAESSVYYTLSPESSSPVNRILKSDILIIRLADGSKIDPNAGTEGKPTSVSEAPAVTAVTYPADKDRINKETVCSFNTACDEVKKLLKMPKKAKNSKGFLMFFDATEQSVLADGLVTIEIRSGRKNGNTYYSLSKEWFNANVAVFKIAIKNNSSQNVFVNLADCQISRNGRTETLYTQTITSTTKTNSSGVGVAVLPGVAVGGGSSTANSTTTVSSQFVTIPAGTEYVTDEILLWKYNPDDLKFSAFNDVSQYGLIMHIRPDLIPGYNKRKIGESNSYEKTDSPLKIRADISYSFDSSFSSKNFLCADLYASETIFCAASSGVAYRLYYDLDVIPLPKNALISEFEVYELPFGLTGIVTGTVDARSR